VILEKCFNVVKLTTNEKYSWLILIGFSKNVYAMHNVAYYYKNISTYGCVMKIYLQGNDASQKTEKLL